MWRRKGKSAAWAELPETWQEALSDGALREAAGDAVFERGERYFDAGKVSMMRDGGGNATFEVDGTQTYTTELSFADESLSMDCTCPHALEGAFCKHMVAAALYWRNELEGNQPPDEPASVRKETSKEKLAAAWKGAMEECTKAWAMTTDKSLGAMVKMGSREVPAAQPLFLNNVHTWEHYGNLVTLLRMNGMVPPSSEGR